MKKENISLAEFARRIGVTKQRVSYAAKRGNIKTKFVDGKLKVEFRKASVEWEANTQKSKRQVKGKAEKKVDKKEDIKTKIKIVEKEIEVPTYDGMTTADAERKEKVFKAKLSELKYLEQAGELVKVIDIKREAAKLARETRDAILSLPARIAHELAAETDPRLSEIMLSRELTKCLIGLIKEKGNGIKEEDKEKNR